MSKSPTTIYILFWIAAFLVGLFGTVAASHAISNSPHSVLLPIQRVLQKKNHDNTDETDVTDSDETTITLIEC